MIEPYPFLTLEQPSNEAVAWATRMARSAGLQVMCTFDLQAARRNFTDCPCPHHGAGPCDCQIVILLVSGDDCQPISLAARSVDGMTSFSVVDTPDQTVNPQLEAAIRQALDS